MRSGSSSLSVGIPVVAGAGGSNRMGSDRDDSDRAGVAPDSGTAPDGVPTAAGRLPLSAVVVPDPSDVGSDTFTRGPCGANWTSSPSRSGASVTRRPRRKVPFELLRSTTRHSPPA